MTSGRILLCTLSILAVSAVAPAVAGASATVSYTAAGGVRVDADAAADKLVVERLSAADRILVSSRFFTPPTPVVAGQGCTADQTGGAVCAITGSAALTMNMGAGDDHVNLRALGAGPDPAVVNGGPGVDRLDGSPRDDTLNGDEDRDELNGMQGSNLLQGGGGNDHLQGDSIGGGPNTEPESNTMRGGEGNDLFVDTGVSATVSAGAGLVKDRFDGGPGMDTADYSANTGPLSLSTTIGGDAAVANDGAAGELDDLDSVERLFGGSGRDTIQMGRANNGPNGGPALLTPGLGYSLHGNAGNDTLLVIGALPISLSPGAGRDTVTGGTGADTLVVNDGTKDTVTCGAGTLDTLQADLRDVPLPTDCETVSQVAVDEGPPVVIASKRLSIDAAGVTSVLLSCPRTLKRPCAGALTARLDKSGKRFGAGTSYSIAPGARATVRVTIRPADQAAAQRKGAALVVRSVEKGTRGLKTVLRTLLTG